MLHERERLLDTAKLVSLHDGGISVLSTSRGEKILRTFFFLVILVHGVIHLFAFLNAHDIIHFKRLTQPISRRAGAIWLSCSLLFVTAAFLYLLSQDYWWMIGIPAILLSQTMIFLSWSDAKFGTIATVIVLVPFVMAIADALPGSFRNIYKEEAQAGISRLGPLPLISDKDIQPLPAPVQKYLRYAGVVGKPIVRNFRATFMGQFRRTVESGWMVFSAQQYDFFDNLTRVFFIKSSVFGIPFEGLHLYRGNSATMQIKVASLFEIVDAMGDTMTRSETVTLFNDMCIMAPATLIDTTIHWQLIDSLSAIGIFTSHGMTISAVLYFDEEGRLVNFSSDDRFLSADGITYQNYRWTTPLDNYKDFDGRNVATHAELIWHLPGDEFVYGKFDLMSVEYNCREFK